MLNCVGLQHSQYKWKKSKIYKYHLLISLYYREKLEISLGLKNRLYRYSLDIPNLSIVNTWVCAC